jgi:pimeloyl-ACP methyl ester carboxylesterase
MRYGALAWGEQDGRLALCLHGFPDTAWTWRYLGPRLAAEGWRVVAPFMRGYAPTDLAPDGDYTIAALGRDAVAAREALGGGADTVLIGHDWGAVAAYPAASRFARVVTMSIPPVSWLVRALRGTLALRQARCSWYMAFNQLPGVSERALSRLIPRLWSDWSPGYDATEDLRNVFDALDGPGHRSAALGPYRALPELRHRGGAVDPPRVPWLYLHGRRDGCMLAEIAERGARGATELEIVEGVGHFLQLERPDEIGERIAAFLKG